MGSVSSHFWFTRVAGRIVIGKARRLVRQAVRQEVKSLRPGVAAYTAKSRAAGHFLHSSWSEKCSQSRMGRQNPIRLTISSTTDAARTSHAKEFAR